MAALRKSTPITPEQYLEMQRNTDVRSEYIAGEMLALAAPSKGHGDIVMNLALALGEQLRNSKCKGNIGIAVAAPASFLIPDLVVYCDEGDFGDDKDILQNPSVVVEVLSPSTSDYDHGHKWILYQQITGLMHYVLVSQDEVRVEVYTRERDGHWDYLVETELESTIILGHINCDIKLASIYERLSFI